MNNNPYSTFQDQDQYHVEQIPLPMQPMQQMQQLQQMQQSSCNNNVQNVCTEKPLCIMPTTHVPTTYVPTLVPTRVPTYYPGTKSPYFTNRPTFTPTLSARMQMLNKINELKNMNKQNDDSILEDNENESYEMDADAGATVSPGSNMYSYFGALQSKDENPKFVPLSSSFSAFGK